MNITLNSEQLRVAFYRMYIDIKSEFLQPFEVLAADPDVGPRKALDLQADYLFELLKDTL